MILSQSYKKYKQLQTQDLYIQCIWEEEEEEEEKKKGEKNAFVIAYSLALHNDISVNNVSHIWWWSHKIIIL